MALTKRPRAAGAPKPKKPARSMAAKQASVDAIALSISSVETANERTMLMLADTVKDLHTFRKENDIHIVMQDTCLKYAGMAAAAIGEAQAMLATLHNAIRDNVERYKLPPAGYRGPVDAKNGGGKN